MMVSLQRKDILYICIVPDYFLYKLFTWYNLSSIIISKSQPTIKMIHILPQFPQFSRDSFHLYVDFSFLIYVFSRLILFHHLQCLSFLIFFYVYVLNDVFVFPFITQQNKNMRGNLLRTNKFERKFLRKTYNSLPLLRPWAVSL